MLVAEVADLWQEPAGRQTFNWGSKMMDFATAREAMVDCQVRPSDVTRYPIIEAMLTIPREEFVPADRREVAYADAQHALPNGRAMLDPRSFAKLLDSAMISGEDMVLIVGSGLGYGAAVIGWMAEAVVALEEDESMVAASADVLASMEVLNVAVENAPLIDGVAGHGPYDVLFFEGAVEAVPETLLAQLKDGGRVAAIVVEGGKSQARIGIKAADGLSWRRAFDATAPVLPGFAVEKSFEF